ncbi:MAG: urea ABC transporter ATP-binding subunit UrtE [Succinivibrio sp.]|nr:urea ABC transporter ATP-binding subunit UrtE [Succinivibrio sp.]
MVFEGLHQYYDESHILNEVNLEVEEGKCTCIMGRNGVGKTTLLKCLMGLLPVRSGRIIFNGQDITSCSPEQRAALGIGYVPQGRQIFPLLTVEENLLTGLAMRKDRLGYIPDYIFDYFPVLKQMEHRLGGDLSGGQQQQLAIGRALVEQPSFLVLDEPTEGIQPNIVREIADTISDLNAKLGLTVLLVEQKVPFAKRVADSYAVMNRGHIVATGSMAGLDTDTIKEFLSV